MPDIYETFDHTADIGIRTTGETLAQAFEHAGYAMFDIISDASQVESEISRKIYLEADDLGILLVDWLSELLYLSEVEELLFSKFEVSIRGTKLSGMAHGEKLDTAKHHLKTEIKAVTYHMLEVDDEKNSVQVLFDI